MRSPLGQSKHFLLRCDGKSLEGVKRGKDLIDFRFFKKDFIYLLLKRGEGREKERERHITVFLPLMRLLLGTQPATQACALTGRELNQRPLGLQASTQSTEPHQPGLISVFKDHPGALPRGQVCPWEPLGGQI